METFPPSLKPQPLVTRLRETGASILVGFAIGFVLWLGDEGSDLSTYLLVCGWIGLAIHWTAGFLCWVGRPLYASLEGLRLRLVLSVLFFVAGSAGFYLGVTTLDLVLRATVGGGLSTGDGRGLLLALAFPGVVGLVVGLGFYSYQSLQERLRVSVDRIRAQEYAERELETARAIQRRLLPPAEVSGAGYRIGARNLPALLVAGDFYDILRDLPGVPDAGGEAPHTAGDGSLGLVVADVSGKGMGASLVTASVKTMISFIAPGRTAAEVLTELNRRLAAELGPREFVALCFLRYQPATGAFELANAGLPDPYVLGADGGGGTAGAAPRPLSAPGPRLPLGLRPELAYETVTGRLEPGERLLLLSDGLPEALKDDEAPLGYERFEELLAAWHGGGALLPGPWLDELFGRLEAETREGRDDDWTALLLERDADPPVGSEG